MNIFGIHNISIAKVNKHYFKKKTKKLNNVIFLLKILMMIIIQCFADV